MKGDKNCPHCRGTGTRGFKASTIGTCLSKPVSCKVCEEGPCQCNLMVGG